MSQPATPGKVPTPKDAEFMFHVIENMEGKPKVDWEKVAAAMGLKSGGVASVRFFQIKRKLGWGDTVAAGSASPSPSKVTKRAPVAGAKGKKAAVVKTPVKIVKKDEEDDAKDDVKHYAGDEAKKEDSDEEDSPDEKGGMGVKVEHDSDEFSDDEV